MDGGTAALVENLHYDSLHNYLSTIHQYENNLKQLRPNRDNAAVTASLSLSDDGDDEDGDCNNEEGRLFVVYFFETFHQLILFVSLFALIESLHNKINNEFNSMITRKKLQKSSEIRVVVEFVGVVKAPSEDFDDVGVLGCSRHPFLVVYLPVYLDLLHMSARSHLHSGLHCFRQVVQQLHLYHQPNHLRHRAVRNGRSVVNLYPLLVSHLDPLVIDHSQLLKSQWIFGVVDVPDKLKYFQLIKGVLYLVVVLLLPTSSKNKI